MGETLGKAAQLVQTIPVVPVPAADTATTWYDKIIYDPVNLISISLAVIAVILGIIPLILYVSERRRSRLLDETVKEFALLDKIRDMRSEELKQSKLSEARRQQIEDEARAMREDVEQRIPNAAMTAYYENTIPQLELQILDIGARLSSMRISLKNIRGLDVIVNPKVQKILSEEISKNVGARRNLEQLQLFLVVCTSITSAILAVIPFPVSILIAIPGAGLTIQVCFKLLIAARVAFPDNSLLATRLPSSRAMAIVTLASVVIIVLGLLFLGFLIYRLR